MFHDALETRQRALSLQSKLYTSDHIDIASSLLFIGQLYRHTKNYDQTLVYFDQCLKIYQANYGEEHVDITQLLRKIELTTNQMNEEAIVGDGVPLRLYKLLEVAVHFIISNYLQQNVAT
ncbi:unnamed protein product, partial [Rotaria magnacalcarata]